MTRNINLQNVDYVSILSLLQHGYNLYFHNNNVSNDNLKGFTGGDEPIENYYLHLHFPLAFRSFTVGLIVKLSGFQVYFFPHLHYSYGLILAIGKYVAAKELDISLKSL